MPGTRKLGKTSDQRMAMLRQQVTDFLDNGKMETTIIHIPDWLCLSFINHIGLLQNGRYFLLKLLL